MILLLLAVTIVPADQSFECTPTRVWDGDGPIWCAEGPRIRLAGIAAREIDGTCKGAQPCPDAGGTEARDKLAILVGRVTGKSAEGHLLVSGPTMACKSEGAAGGERTAAWCISPKSGDVNCAALASGFALKWPRYWKGHSCGMVKLP